MDRKKILIVDDEPDVLKYLELLFLDSGFDVITATNGAECVNKSRTERPDLITLDISMPSESGIRVLRDLKDNILTRNIPVIMITGVTGQFKKDFSSDKKVNRVTDYFEKPIDREKLVCRIKEIISIG